MKQVVLLAQFPASPISDNPLPIFTVSSDLQSIKASGPIAVTLSGISMLVKPMQKLNALPSMVYNPLGRSMLVSALQSANEYLPKVVTPSGI